MLKTKIVYLTNDLLLGGTQSIVLDIASSIDASRYEREMWYLDDHKNGDATRPDFVPKFEEAGIRTRCFGVRRFIPGIFALRRALKEAKPDIIHVCLPDAVIIGTIAARLAGVKRVVIHEQNTHKFYSWKLNAAFAFARSLADLTIAYSDTLEDELFGAHHILRTPIERIEHRSYTIYNAIRTDNVAKVNTEGTRRAKRAELGISDDDILLFTAARLVDWKGHAYLIEAFADVITACPNAKLRIAGEGPQESELTALIRKHGLEDSVLLLGPRTDVYELLAAADIFPQAYAYPEGFSSITLGMSGMEAMAFGLPVVASRYPALYEGIEDGKNVLLVEPRDVAGLSGALMSLCKDSTLRMRIGSAARRYVEERFSYAVSAKIYESLYDALSKP